MFYVLARSCWLPVPACMRASPSAPSLSLQGIFRVFPPSLSFWIFLQPVISCAPSSPVLMFRCGDLFCALTCRSWRPTSLYVPVWLFTRRCTFLACFPVSPSSSLPGFFDPPRISRAPSSSRRMDRLGNLFCALACRGWRPTYLYVPVQLLVHRYTFLAFFPVSPSFSLPGFYDPPRILRTPSSSRRMGRPGILFCALACRGWHPAYLCVPGRLPVLRCAFLALFLVSPSS